MFAPAELTIQRAADLLELPLAHLVHLLDTKQIPSRIVGVHRRVLLAEVLEFKQQQTGHREAVLRRMSETVELFGLEY